MPELTRGRYVARPLSEASNNPDALSISEFNTLVKDVLTSGIPRAIWVTGEIQEYDRNKDKKHVFFSLVEKDPQTSEVKARIGAVIFAMTRPRIDEILKRSENAFDLKDDIEAKFLCKVDFYPPHGAVRLVVETIDPVHTLGKMAQEKQKLIAQLSKEGVLDRNKALELSALPLSIGLITAFDSAAYNDFLDELKQSRLSFKLCLVRALMQGKGCAESVADALNALNARKDLDAIVITRGGGSISDLSAFDSRLIADAIAASRYPVLTGIGHEINTSIADMAAHTFAKTPTAIAQLLVARVASSMQAATDHYTRILDLAQEWVRRDSEGLHQRALRLRSATASLFQDRREAHLKAVEAIKHLPLRQLAGAQSTSVEKWDALKKIIHLRTSKSLNTIQHYQKLMTLASPQRTLQRGFSITRDKNGRTVRDVQELVKGARLTTEFASGNVTSIVEALSKENENA